MVFQWVFIIFLKRGDDGCLSVFRLVQQNTRGWIDYKQWKFISYSFGGRRSRKGPAPLVSDKGPLWVLDCQLLTVSLHGGRDLMDPFRRH